MKIFAFIPVTDNGSDSLQAMLSLPDSTVVRNGNPVFVPDFDDMFTARTFLAVKISRLGKTIAERFADRYYETAAPAFCITAENLLSRLRVEGLPWTEATAFDKSCPVGEFIPFERIEAEDLKFEINGQVSQTLPPPKRDVIRKAISIASRNNTLKMGDLILLPFPEEKPFELIPDNNIRLLAGEEALIELPIR